MFYFFRKCSWCRDLGSSGPKNQHSLEEHFFHRATTNSILAPVRPARLQRWLPRRAKPSLHGSWRRTESKCRWSCNVTLTMRKPLPQHTPGSPWETGGYLQLRSLHCTISIWDGVWPWQLAAVSKLKFLCSHRCRRDLASNGSNNNQHSLENNLGILLLQLQ